MAEKTLIIFKPDSVQRRLCGRILTRIESKGFKIVGMKMLQITKELVSKHYAEHVGKEFFPRLEKFTISSPVIVLAVEGNDVVITKDDDTTVKIFIETPKERAFIKSFFGI